MSVPRRLFLALILAFVGLAFAAPAAWAHAGLVSSNPTSGATLETAPAQVVMNFTEEPDLDLSFVHVLNTLGADVGTGRVRQGADAKQIVVALPAGLPNGSYTVSWVVISAEDGHRTAGAFAFGVGTAPVAPLTTGPAAPATPSPPPLSVAGKTILYAGLSLAVGAVATALFAFGGYVAARRRLLPTAGVLTLAGAVMLLIAERATAGVSFATLFHARAGKPYLWLLAGSIVTLIAALYAARRTSRDSLLALGVAAAATMLARVQGGHASAQGVAWFQVLAQWIHFLAVGVWVGGFVPVLLMLRERRGYVPDGAMVTRARRYSSMAGVSLLLVAITGSIRAVSSLGGFGAPTRIFDSSYGTVLAIKVGVAVALIALGTVNRHRSISRLEAGDAGMLRRVMRLEVVTAVGILGLTALLTGLPPDPPPPQPPPPPSRATASGSDFATTMKLTLTVSPGTPGPNTFDLGVADYDTGAPLADVTGATLTFTLPGRADVGQSTLDLERDASGAWTGTGSNLSIAGTWRVTTLVQQGAHATTVLLSLTTAAPPQQITSTPPTPGQLTIYTITLAGGRSLQTYNDPGAAGPNQLHVTAFDRDGSELPLKSIAVTAGPEGGEPRTLKTTRFSAGHFVASEVLTDGAWHFDIQATARDGSVLQAFFDQTIGQT
jgi:copper transport protein